MLKTRVITALWLAPLAFLLVFGLPTEYFALALAAVLLVGAWEFQRLAALKGGLAGWALVATQALIFAVLFIFGEALAAQAANLLFVATGAWLLMLLRLREFQPGVDPGNRYRALGFACALLSLTFAWLSLSWLHSLERGSWWILALLLIIWAADTGAYFTGRAIGRHKLAARISPGKTIEGLAGGLLASAIVGWAAITFLPLDQPGRPHWLVLSALTALLSAGGDLFVSLHKRTSGLKDSGRLFPGHGGVLDRLDSLLAGAPVFALGVLLLGNNIV